MSQMGRGGGKEKSIIIVFNIHSTDNTVNVRGKKSARWPIDTRFPPHVIIPKYPVASAAHFSSIPEQETQTSLARIYFQSVCFEQFNVAAPL